MKISKKSQYALRAVFELSFQNRDEPVKTQDIARSQKISLRFAEIILNELKRGGFVNSVRGSEGGYLLTRPPDEITVKEVIECIEGPVSISQEQTLSHGNNIVFGNNAFAELWKDVNDVINDVLSEKTFKDLIKSEIESRKIYTLNYNI